MSSAADTSSNIETINIVLPTHSLVGSVNAKKDDHKKIVVLCHGLISNRFSSVAGAALKELDFNTCSFDFAGNGESTGVWVYSGYDREVEDLRAVVTYLREKGWDVQAILGHSKGAAAVMQYGERYGDVPQIFNVAGRFDTSQTPRSRFTEEQWQDLEETGKLTWTVRGKDYPVTKADFADRAALNMKRSCEAIRGRGSVRVHVIHGTGDETIPVKDARDFFEALGGDGGCSTLDIVDGASHSFNKSRQETAAVLQAIQSKLS